MVDDTTAFGFLGITCIAVGLALWLGPIALVVFGAFLVALAIAAVE